MSNKCQRCARAGRDCVYTVHSKTRRRKRTDTRVKELEEKVRNLSVLLEQGRHESSQPQRATSSQPSVDPNEGMDEEYEDVSDDQQHDDDHQDYEGTGWFNAADARKKGVNAAPFLASKGPTQSPEPKSRPSFATPSFNDEISGTSSGVSPDVIDRGLLTMQEATDLFDRYVNVLSPNYPAVVLAKGTSAVETRSERPILWVPGQKLSPSYC